MVKRILVGIGDTAYTPVAIQMGVELAQRQESELTAVTVVDTRRLEYVGPVPAGGEGAAHDLREYRTAQTTERVEQGIALFEQACADAGVGHAVRRETGDALSLLTSLARYHDVMVFGLKNVIDQGLDFDPPNVLAQLIRGGIRPVIAVADRYREIKRVLIAYSGSMESAKTVRRFVQLRLWPDAALRLATFGHEPAVAEALLADMASYCHAHGLTPERIHADGVAKERIVEQADVWDADMIVLGQSAQSLFLRKILGDTTTYLTEHANRPLFLHR